MKKRILFIIILFFCLIGVVNAEKCTVITGDGTNYGDEVRCGTESFYVLKKHNQKTQLIAKYNLFVGDHIDYIEADDDAPWRYLVMDNKVGINKYKAVPLGSLQNKLQPKFLANDFFETATNYCENLAVSRNYNPYFVYPMIEDAGDREYVVGCRVYEKIEYEHVVQDERALGTKIINGKSVLPLWGITYMVPQWGYDAIHDGIIRQNVYDANGDLILEGSSFEGYINGYKTELERQGIAVDNVSMANLSKILEFLEAISGRDITVHLIGSDYGWCNQNYSDPIDCIVKMDIKEYVPEQFEWLYDRTYWMGSGFKYEDQGGNYVSPSEYNDYFISNEGFLCALGRGECGYFKYPIGQGVRPIVTVDSDDVVIPQGTLIVKYVDQYGISIDPSVDRNETYNYGTSYTSSMIPFTNYNYVGQTGDAPNGVVEQETITIYYNYQIKPADVTTKYVDENGNNIVAPDFVESYWGNNYSTTQRSFINYSFVRVAENSDPVSGTIGKDHIVVTYVYHLKEANILIRHIDADTMNNIIPVITQPKHWGDEYHVSPSPDISNNYEFVSVQGGPEDGIVAQDTIEIQYYYRLKTTTLVVRYVDENENDIDPSLNRNETVHWGDNYTSEQKNIPNYEFVRLSGDPANGTISKNDVEVVYHYKLKGSVLVVRYVDQDNHDIDVTKNRNETVHWGDSYTSEQLEFTNYNYKNRTGAPASGTIGADLVEIIYHYEIKPATLVVKYVDEDDNNIDPALNRNEAVHWGDDYTTEQKDIPNYNFTSRTGAAANGTIGADLVEVIYHYELKPSTITVHHYIKGTTDRIAADEIIPKRYTQSYTTTQLDTADLDYEFDSVEGAVSGTVNEDSYEITYFYKLKKGTVRVHHYILGTTTKLVPDVDQEYDYTTEYNTLVSTDVSPNYEFHSRTTNYTGIVRSPLIEVSYYYQLKDSNLDTNITITGTEEITNKSETVNYHIKYEAAIAEYIGDGTVVITATLPYKIDEDNSDIAGGTYNSSNKTIKWTVEYEDIDSYNEPNELKEITIEKDLALKYVGIVGRDRTMVASAKGKLTLSNNSRETTNSTSTDIRISGKIIVKYVDENNKELLDDIESTGLVGESYATHSEVIEGYKLVERPTSENLEYEEEEQVIKYIYERLKVQITTVANDGGEITGDEFVFYGDDSTPDKIIIKAKEGYVIESVKINGEEIKIKANQEMLVLGQLHHLKEDQVVEVSFKLKENPETSAFIISSIIILLIISLVVALISFKKYKFIIK